MSGRITIMRSRATYQGIAGPLRGWFVMDDDHAALCGSFEAALHFATRLTTQPRQEPQAMTTSPVIQPQVDVLDAQRTIALAEHALKVDPALLTAVADRQAIERVRDAVNDAWLER